MSDGVFSVALTILVVNVSNTESIEKISKGEFRLFFPIFFSFIFSFVVIGMYWVAHHNEMNLIQRSDRPFLWLSLLFLLSTACIPFSAAYLGKNWIWNGTFDESPILEERKGVFLYSGNLFLAGILLQALWHYARKRKNSHGDWLLKKDVTKEEENESLTGIGWPRLPASSFLVYR
jgi:uncharacterized membrane protein